MFGVDVLCVFYTFSMGYKPLQVYAVFSGLKVFKKAKGAFKQS
jgi:hypothetical protein